MFESGVSLYVLLMKGSQMPVYHCKMNQARDSDFTAFQ